MTNYEEFKEKNKELIEESARQLSEALDKQFLEDVGLTIVDLYPEADIDEKHKRYKHLFN